MNSDACRSHSNPLVPGGQEQMHAAHPCWRNEFALWHEELKLWQDELKLARDNLTAALNLLETHAKKLEKHGASLTLYGQDALEHEHTIAEYQRGGDKKCAALAIAQQAETERHAHLREIHEQFKRLHHAVVARCSLLQKNFHGRGLLREQKSSSGEIQG